MSVNLNPVFLDGTVGSTTVVSPNLERMIYSNVKLSDSGTYIWTMTINSQTLTKSINLIVKRKYSFQILAYVQ